MTQEKIIFEFQILFEGVDCDDTAWIMERNDGTRYLRMTDHGYYYEADKNELLERISKYENLINQTHKALSLLTDP